MSAPERDPVPLSSGDLPSSFDSDPDFFNEGRASKLWRKLRQEPLIPLGGAATCVALYMASKSIRAGDHNQTNRMFRARIYAQGFTLVAIVAGSIFYKDERLQRKKYEKVVEEKKALEKRDKWLRELEARDEEDRAWREKIEAPFREMSNQAQDVTRKVEKAGGAAKKAVEDQFSSKSVREQVVKDGWGPGMWSSRAVYAWKRL